MTDAELINHYGGPAQLAKKLGWNESKAIQRIYNWRTRGIPPAVKLKHPDLFLHPVPAVDADPAAAPLKTEGAKDAAPEDGGSHA